MYIHPGNIIKTEQVAFGNIYVQIYTYKYVTTIKKKKAPEFESQDTAEIGGTKGKGEKV